MARKNPMKNPEDILDRSIRREVFQMVRAGVVILTVDPGPGRLKDRCRFGMPPKCKCGDHEFTGKCPKHGFMIYGRKSKRRRE